VRDNWWGLMPFVMLVAIGTMGGALMVPQHAHTALVASAGGLPSMAGLAHPMIDGTYYSAESDLRCGRGKVHPRHRLLTSEANGSGQPR